VLEGRPVVSPRRCDRRGFREKLEHLITEHCGNKDARMVLASKSDNACQVSKADSCGPTRFHSYNYRHS
jgi:hypothetical protein